MQISFRYHLFILFLSGVLFSVSVYSQSVDQDSHTPAIGGYSPVSYFTKNNAEQGKEEFAVKHRGSTYYLASADQVELFTKDPEKYEPKYKVCPYSLTLGGAVPLDPTNFKIVGGSLLLFHKTEESDGLKQWNDSPEEEQQLIELADKEYILLEF
ncbi:Uncharacterised protein [Halioglobus japonicus]|nr:Uncharacterised protein [Halioglobus japonicus]